jgi:heme a synthase
MQTQRSSRPVAIWLLVGVAMIMVQIVLGGITRLTGSGLSITEWDVITGALPPLNEAQWLAEFQKYQQTPQFRLLNFDFGLSDFKFIFFWEWAHRLWARLIGIVFAVPFLIFLVQRRFTKELVRPMIALFILGALQGAVGWVMVASGLTGDAVYVAPTRLAAHFVLALLLLAYTFWAALKLLVPHKQLVLAPRLKTLTIASIVLLFVQFVFGALMAGHKAAPAAPTWPDINGSSVPDYVLRNPHGLLGLIDDRIMIHFIHRSIAYILVLLVIVWTVQAVKQKATPLWATLRWLPLATVVLQTALGIATVLSSTGIRAGRWNLFEWMAQLHQVVAFFLLLSLVAAAFVLRRQFPKPYKAPKPHVQPAAAVQL